MVDKRNDEFVHEVEEDIRWEKFEKLAKEYGSYAAAGVLAIILGVAGYEYWTYSALRKQEQASEVYTDSLQLMVKNRTNEAIEKLKTIKDDGSGYGMLAHFQMASALVDNPETRGQAVAIFKEVAGNKSIDRRYRTLGIIFLVLAELDTADPAELSKYLEETKLGVNMWPDMTQELSALVAVRKGDMDEAKKILNDLKDDKQASQGVRLRARALLEQLQIQTNK